MLELYLLSVLSTLKIIALVFVVVTGVATFISGVGKVITDPVEDASDYKSASKAFKLASPIFVISLILTLFCPSKPELYMIFGVGSAIDYLQSSDAAKQLPDKTLNVLNKMCDEYLDKSCNSEQ